MGEKTRSALWTAMQVAVVCVLLAMLVLVVWGAYQMHPSWWANDAAVATPPAAVDAVPLKPDPAEEDVTGAYCATGDHSLSCRPTSSSDPDGCMRATENAPYDAANPDAGIPQDCLAKGY
jgi:hypothetical protein